MAYLTINARPPQGEGCGTRFQFHRGSATLLTIEGEDVAFPQGCAALEIIPRLCGDFYAEIKGGGFYVSACSERPKDAVRLAIGLIPNGKVQP